MIETLPFQAIPVRQLLAGAMDDVPERPGLYAMTFAEGDDWLRRWGYFGFDDHSPPTICGASTLYLGETAVMGLRARIRSHLCRDARCSTFRMTIGTLWADDLGLTPVLTPNKRYFHFGADGEAKLTAWLADHASVAFFTCQDGLAKEKALLRSLPIPLNIKERRTHPFSRHLIERRRHMVWSNRPSVVVPTPVVGMSRCGTPSAFGYRTDTGPISGGRRIRKWTG